MPQHPPFRRRLAMTLLLAAVGMAACSRADGASDIVQAGLPAVGTTLFTRLPPEATGIRFVNRLRETREFNVFTYRNFYNGGGVAIGDLTGDGLPEVILTANHDGPTIYRNEGGFRFRDVTQATGVTTPDDAWTTGVLLADLDGDGRLDIYLSRAGLGAPERRANALWLNAGVDENGVPTFREVGARFGVADQGYSTHAAVLDFDRDGDLDLFILDNSPKPAASFGLRNTRHVRDAYGGAKLLRNDPAPDGAGRRFTDVSAAAGIHSPEIAFGLGVVASDVNRDGWPDLYVANDFFERDYLYVNRGDGTFAEALDRQMPVLSHFSMGLDIADVDDDGWPDVYTTDMLPEDDERLKTMASFEGWDSDLAKARNGFHHQSMRNMLQRNNRDGTFSDVGQLAGVARTDWSWSALIADLDLDGRKDIFVTNGLARDITSQDYIAFLADDATLESATRGGRAKVDLLELTRAMTTTKLSNYAFRNDGPMRFVDAAAEWGLATPNISNGAAYGDLDGDGALDLVVNAVGEEALVYRNDARALRPGHHALRVWLEGDGANRFGVGARVTVHARGAAIVQEQSPSRGFQSSVDYRLVFGLGAAAQVDSIVVEWPDGRRGVQRALAADSLVTLRQSESVVAAPAAPVVAPTLLTADSTSIDARHVENDFVDFDRERLIPRMLSREGPPLAAGDVNGDGLDDLYLGGAKEQSGRLFLQRRDGRFTLADTSEFALDAISEDVGATFLDADGDGRLDLYVVSGGNEFSEDSPGLQDRLYLNVGGGRLRKATGHLPTETISGSRPVAADYDGDGDVDLFVGGRVVPWRYGLDPRSMLLRNDGRGRFTAVTAELAPALAKVGMVTDAIWRDVDGDGRLDLVVVGDWMPVTIFRNVGGGRLVPMNAVGLERSHGWWNRIVAGDFDGDGDVDFVVGNLGLNSRLRATASQPATMHVKDFDRNGFLEQVVSYYNGAESYPLALRDDLLRALPFLRAKYPTYRHYARQRVTDIFTAAQLEGAVVRMAHTFATSLVRNEGAGRFAVVPLPDEAQLAPVFALLATDVDGDRHTDLLLAGNFGGVKPEVGRMLASRGLLLRGDGAGRFAPMHATASGFVVPGEARDIVRIRTAAGVAYVVSRNGDRPLRFARPVRARAAPAVADQ